MSDEQIQSIQQNTLKIKTMPAMRTFAAEIEARVADSEDASYYATDSTMGSRLNQCLGCPLMHKGGRGNGCMGMPGVNTDSLENRDAIIDMMAAKNAKCPLNRW